MFESESTRFRDFMEKEHDIPPVPTQDWHLLDAAKTLHHYFCHLDSRNYDRTFNTEVTIQQLADAYAAVNDGLKRVKKDD